MGEAKLKEELKTRVINVNKQRTKDKAFFCEKNVVFNLGKKSIQ
jgi:hypothetical protein